VTLGNWLSHDLTGGVNGNLSRTRRPTSINTLGTSDYSGSLRGALLVFQATPVGSTQLRRAKDPGGDPERCRHGQPTAHLQLQHRRHGPHSRGQNAT